MGRHPTKHFEIFGECYSQVSPFRFLLLLDPHSTYPSLPRIFECFQPIKGRPTQKYNNECVKITVGSSSSGCTTPTKPISLVQLHSLPPGSRLLCVLSLTTKHIMVECSNLRDIRENSSWSALLRSCLKALITILFSIFIKNTILITNCNVCYFNFILVLKPWI